MNADNTSDNYLERLPKPIVEKLWNLIKRVRRIVLLRGSLAVASVAVGSILSVMAIDASITIFSRGMRWIISLTGLTATAAAAYWFLYRPLLKKFTMASIARVIETRRPEFQERISSAVELLSSSQTAEFQGSKQLIDELVKEAASDAHTVNPDKEFTARSAKPYMIASSIVCAVLALLFVFWPGQTSRLFARAVAPYAEIGNIYSGKMHISPGDIKVASGDSVTIKMTVADQRRARAELYRVNKDGSETVERMKCETDKQGKNLLFSITFPSVTQSFKYRILFKNALSAFYHVDVVTRPSVEQMNICYEYPAYTHMPRKTEKNAAGDITAVPSTKITLFAQLNKPVSSCKFMINGKRMPEFAESMVNDKPVKTWQFVMGGPKMSGIWSFHMTDEFGFENLPITHKIKSIVDRAPTVQIAKPVATELHLKPTEFLPIIYVARDDFGISAADLMLGIDANEMTSLPQNLPIKQDNKRDMWRGRAVLDLAALNLSKARLVKVQIRVADILPAKLNGPQYGMSEVISIHIDQKAKPLAEQTFDVQKSEISNALKNVIDRLQQAKLKAKNKDKQLANWKVENWKQDKTIPANVLNDIKEIRHQTATAEAVMNKLADKVENTVYSKLAPNISNVAKENITPAREAAEMIPLSDEIPTRVEHAKTMQRKIDESIAAVKNLQNELEKTSKKVDVLAELDNLANRENQLARKSEKLPFENEKTQAGEEWQNEQKDFAKDLGNFVSKNPEALNNQLQTDREAALMMAAEATDLAKKTK